MSRAPSEKWAPVFGQNGATLQISRPAQAEGLIGPNAVLQLLPLIERIGGRTKVEHMLMTAGIYKIPDGTEMIQEGDAARLHQLLRSEEPALAPCLATEAGRRTARYILDNRIPKPVQVVLKLLPAGPAAHLLSKAIAQHAWTFVGSGSFRVVTPWRFEIKDNPVIRGEVSHEPLCVWHAAVFEELYRVLVHPDCRCRETECAAEPGRDACVFELTRHTTG